jgi:hypothetical protein
LGKKIPYGSSEKMFSERAVRLQQFEADVPKLVFSVFENKYRVREIMPVLIAETCSWPFSKCRQSRTDFEIRALIRRQEGH